MKHLGGSTLGGCRQRWPASCDPIPICGVVEGVGAITQDDAAYARRSKPLRHLTPSCAAENVVFIDALSALRVLQPASQVTGPVVVTAPSHTGAAWEPVPQTHPRLAAALRLAGLIATQF